VTGSAWLLRSSSRITVCSSSCRSWSWCSSANTSAMASCGSTYIFMMGTAPFWARPARRLCLECYRTRELQAARDISVPSAHFLCKTDKKLSLAGDIRCFNFSQTRRAPTTSISDLHWIGSRCYFVLHELENAPDRASQSDFPHKS